MCLAWIVENGSSAKVDELDNILFSQDAVVQLKISVCKTHLVEVFYAIANLTEYAVNFWTTHFPSHYDRKEVVGSKLHNL